jgi:phenylalanyl-tRNA synthetase beta chain
MGPSPLWLKARLSAAGDRPITNGVDITNYVNHDLGSPLHAYDHALIAGPELVARRARPHERIETIDHKERELDSDMLVIADAEGPQGIAGIMGAAGSEISDATTTVVLEAANFDRVQIMRTSHRLGLRSDASNRWEKGVDPHLAPVAARAAARRMVELTGAPKAPAPIDVHGPLPARATIHLRERRLGAITGIEIPANEVDGILDRLGFEPRRAGDGWDVTVPTARWLDVTREIDVVEEVARIHGLDKVPSRLPFGAHGGGLTRSQTFRRLLVDAACAAGVYEAVTPALIADGWDDRVGLAPDDPRRAVVRIRNPISAEHAVMRTLLLPSLLQAVARNEAGGRRDASLCELAHVYLPAEGELLPDEPWRLGAVLHGHLGGEGWRTSGPEAGFFVAKGVLEAVARAAGIALTFEPGAGRDAFLHPGRAARVLAGGVDAGFLGELHPRVAERYELEGPVAVFEVDVATLEAALPTLLVETPFADVPPLRQDIAVVVADEHLAGELESAARSAGGALLRDVGVFDVYRGPALGEGRRSLAIRLTFQAEDRTLTDEEVRPIREKIVEQLAERFGATLRS